MILFRSGLHRETQQPLASCWLLLILLLAWPERPADAAGATQDAGPTIKQVRIGFDNQYKVGFWTPVFVTWSGGQTTRNGQSEILLPDGDGMQTRFVESVMLPAGVEQTVLHYVKFGRVNSGVMIQLRCDQRIVAAKTLSAAELPRAALATQRLMVTVGQSVGAVDAMRLQRRATYEQESLLSAIVTQAGELPDRWFGYESVDTLVLTTSQADLIDNISDSQLAALQQWVRLGGKLILCVGARGKQVLGDGGRLRDLAPGRFVEVVAQRSSSGLETYASATQRLDLVQGDVEFQMPLTVLREVRGRVEAYEGAGPQDRPTVVRSPLGFGQVVFVAIDLDQPPVAQWQGRPRLVARIMEGDAERRDERADPGRSGQVTHVGYTDLVGQLRGALDQFRGVTLVRFSWVATLLVVYILLIGPGDYFLVKKLFRRMTWTWLTFSLIVVGFCLLAYLLNEVWKGRRLLVNQVDLVDVDVEGALLRGTTWAHIYSPTMDFYNLSLETSSLSAGQKESAQQAPQSGVLLSWQGLPGEGLGGMNTRATAAIINEPYTIADEAEAPQATGAAAIQNMPIQVASTKTLNARWWSTFDAGTTAQLTARSNGLLRGEVTNPLPVELFDCMVLHDVWAYRIEGKLAAGQTVRIEDQAPPRNLEWRLTRRSVIETKDVSTPWDQTSFDVPRILEIMMFHGAARGQAYTQLSHRYQAFVDLSDQLRTGRAILVGRIVPPASSLLRDGKPLTNSYDQHWTFCRVLLPVTRT